MIMRERIKELVAIIADTLPTVDPVYEFGSFQVDGQEVFADLRPYFPGHEYVGTDARPGVGVDWILDLHNIDLPMGSIGTAVCVDTLEHVEYPRRAVDEICRVLKPDGMCVITSVMNFPIHDYPHDYWRFTPQGFQSLLKLFPHTFVGASGQERFPHTVVGIGWKSDPDTVAYERFKEAFDKWK